MSGINQASAFGSFYSEGMQFGYNFKNAPVTVYGGVDTLKYNSGLGGSFFAFNSTTGAGSRLSRPCRRRIQADVRSSACRST